MRVHPPAAPALALLLALGACGGGDGASAESPGAPALPGVSVDHLRATKGRYVGSPSIAILPDGSYLASHDDFGPASDLATTKIFRSTDRGAHWAPLATVRDQYWSTLFWHRGALYLFGTSREFGFLSVRRSTDGGATWSRAQDAASGLLRQDAPYHTAPVPLVSRGGRLWRAFEIQRGSELAIVVASIDEGADLLDAAQWRFGPEMRWSAAWNAATGVSGGWPWEETNVVSDGAGIFRLLARLNNASDGLAPELSLQEPAPGVAAPSATTPNFVALPGAAKKFVIRHDPLSGRFWAITNPPLKADSATIARLGVGAVRNTLALYASPDARTWCLQRTLQQHPDAERHGFHYADWQFDGSDLVYVTRTAFDDDGSGAPRAHDANYLMFGRVADYRSGPCTAVP